jgi:hypothetical protein
MIKNNINEVKTNSMSNSLIEQYLKDPKIIRYNDLKNYNSIEELLPNNKDYVILLYESLPNEGSY